MIFLQRSLVLSMKIASLASKHCAQDSLTEIMYMKILYVSCKTRIEYVAVSHFAKLTA